MQKSPKIIALSEKLYGKLLRLYPHSHRRDYAEPIAQLFRDQCRDAFAKERTLGLIKLWLHTLPDIGKTSLLEQFTTFKRNLSMNYISAKRGPMILMVIGLALGILSLCIVDPAGTWRWLATAAFIVIFAQALTELFQPSSQYAKILLRTVLVIICLSLFMPACMPAFAKAKAGVSALPTSLGSLVFLWFICLMANPLVATLKLLQHFITDRRIDFRE